jgi:glycosyltransferase involved in cell wall biosynthesis
MNGLHLVKWPVQVDRKAGFLSRSFIFSTQPAAYALFRSEDFDVVCDQMPWHRDDWHWRGLVDLLLRGDIRVAFFDSLLFPVTAWHSNALALRLQRMVGIRIVMVPHGMDVFYLDGRRTRYDWMRRAQADYPGWDLAQHREVAKRRTAMWCRHANLVVSADSTSARFLPRRDLSFKWFPVDCDALRPKDTGARTRPVVMHAPQHRTIKGTAMLCDAAERLAARGVPLVLRLVEKVARDEALRLYADADILADQFCMGAFGMFALEGLALGKPVIAYLDQEHLGDPVFNLPIVNANPDNLERVLVVLLQVPELRARIGQAGREAAERYQSIEALAEVWAQLYRHVWWGEPLRLEQTHHFSRERKPRSFTENPAHGDFWPVPVGDLLPEINAALEHLATAARSELAVLS